ncbi:hypothetical protein IWX75_002605 [Arthrobacter sp. CAN_A6]
MTGFAFFEWKAQLKTYFLNATGRNYQQSIRLSGHRPVVWNGGQQRREVARRRVDGKSGGVTQYVRQAVEILLDDTDVTGELRVIPLYLTDGENHLRAVRMWEHSDRVGDDSSRRESHVVIDYSKSVPFDELNLHPSHRRLNE